VFEEGDIFFLNEEGVMLFKHIQGENGIIINGPYALYRHDFHGTPETIEYAGYDILIKGRLFKEIPEKFLKRVVKI
jgi:hypothetical protein